MKRLTENFSGILHRGNNIGGKPWTQFRFSDDDGDKHDSIFYRIDRDRKGYYLAVRQYQYKPTEGKADRLSQLRQWWV